MIKSIALLATAALLGGCVTASPVVEMGNDQFLITGHASGGLNAGKGEALAAQQAADFCRKQNKAMELRNTQTNGIAAVGGESASIQFTCVPLKS